MKKILIQKNESISVLIEHLLSVKDKNVVFVIPRGSALAASLDNFHMLRDEAKEAGKNIFIETVDGQVLALAKAAKIEAANPFFAGPKHSLSDIVIGEEETGGVEEDDEGDGDKNEENLDERIQRKFQMPKIRQGRRRTILLAGSLLVLLVGGVALIKVLPRADVQIVTKKIEWTYDDTLTVQAQVFSETRNMQKAYPASERKQIERKAAGEVTIFNAYSSAPQTLVASTRLETPDKKIYRLNERVIVPGAKIEGGKIVPSSITVSVTAAEAGDEYNIGPIEKFVFPGFRESKLPQYDGFTASSNAPMAGGFAGEAWYPSDDDLVTARADMEGVLRSALQTVVYGSIPNEFEIFENAVTYKVGREEIIEGSSGEKMFTLFVEAVMNVPAYREKDIIVLLTEKAQEDLKNEYNLLEHSLEVRAPVLDEETAQMTLSTIFTGVFERPINIEGFRERAAGKEEIDLRALVFSLPGVESARISFWPIWVSRVPDNAEKIRVSID